MGCLRKIRGPLWPVTLCVASKKPATLPSPLGFAHGVFHDRHQLLACNREALSAVGFASGAFRRLRRSECIAVVGRLVKLAGLPPEGTKNTITGARSTRCAGGVTVSYFEWVQDRQGYFWRESVVIEQLEHIMRTAFEDVLGYAESRRVNNRIAAYMLAIDRVAYTVRQRGIYA
jgi:hypothetical protein